MSLQVVGTPVEGTTLSVNKQYWGGEEGESVFRWFRVLFVIIINSQFFLVLTFYIVY